MGNKVPVLFERKEDCCACGACLNVCPRKAIHMEKDAYGFLYPVIHAEECIGCGLCKKVCSFTRGREAESDQQTTVYAAASSNEKTLQKSSSGGIFAELAEEIIKKDGVVYGAAWEPNLNVCHISVEDLEAIEKLQGSKYVQSDTRRVFTEAKGQLEQGRCVLFCGTPCQISGLHGYLGKDYENLFTVDIICHGVPNSEMLRTDLQHLSGDLNRIDTVTFRDKSFGWGKYGSYTCANGKKYQYNSMNSPYYYYFQQGSIYRDSCYHCRYPSQNRVGDITLGDYWGIEAAHQDVQNCMDIRKGVSCILVNTEKGEKLISLIRDRLSMIPSQLDLVKRRNGQLIKCCTAPADREQIMDAFAASNYTGLRDYWKKHERKSLLVMRVKRWVPGWIKRCLKKA